MAPEPLLRRGIRLRTSVCVLILLCHLHLSAQNTSCPVRINEMMAVNRSIVESPDFMECCDWIELFNTADSSFDLTGFTLTDDPAEPQKWALPARTVMAPHGWLLLWADNRNTGCHTAFALSGDGESLHLFSPDGMVADSVTFGVQSPDVSWGRWPDGTGAWVYMHLPTPGAANGQGSACFGGSVVITPDGGFYDQAVAIALEEGQSGDALYYTLDGSVPDTASFRYTEPFTIHETAVVRACALPADGLPGPVTSRTFFIDEQTTLPVVSIATDPDNLWSDESGIYVEGTNGITGYGSSQPRNWNQTWEKPVSFEFFEADRNGSFRCNAGMQIGGGFTRLYPQKTLALYSRSEFGASKFNYPFFEDLNYTAYNNLNLRNSGQDWWRALLRDGLMHTLVKGYLDIDGQAYKPAILFLNGEYFGIHALREKHNEHYLALHYGVAGEDIDILFGRNLVKQGSAANYLAMLDYIGTYSLADAAHFGHVAEQMDVDQYMDYVIAEIYAANIDWPGGNIKYYRLPGSHSKWRWILFDTDLGFGAHQRGQYTSNTLANVTSDRETYYANPPWATFLLRKLLENESFRNAFIQRFAVHLNVTFNPHRVMKTIDSLKTNIEAEIPRHIEKWEKSTSFGSGWAYHIGVMKTFAYRRPGAVFGHIIDKFGLSGKANLQVTASPEGGDVYIEGVRLPEASFAGTFFKGVPLACRAVPRAGYHFAGWRGAMDSDNPDISLVFEEACSLEAVFEKSTAVPEEVSVLPGAPVLLQNHPNPFNEQTLVSFLLPVACRVSVKVLDTLGRTVETLVDGHLNAGPYSCSFRGSHLPSGVYLVQLSTPGDTQIKKVILSK